MIDILESQRGRGGPIKAKMSQGVKPHLFKITIAFHPLDFFGAPPFSPPPSPRPPPQLKRPPPTKSDHCGKCVAQLWEWTKCSKTLNAEEARSGFEQVTHCTMLPSFEKGNAEGGPWEIAGGRRKKHFVPASGLSALY